jgi:uncharacterized protein Usg
MRSGIIQPWNNRLTTADILYHMPDHPGLLQSFVWQYLGVAPSFPRLRKFLDYWVDNIDGRLHSVTVAHASLAERREIRIADGMYRLH